MPWAGLWFILGKDILKKTDECVKVIEETIFELEMEEVTFEEE